MELSFHSGLFISEATEGDIHQHLPGEIYTILHSDDGRFIQCHVTSPWPVYGSCEFKSARRGRRRIRKYPSLPRSSRVWPNQGYFLEYQDGSTAKHYRATDNSINLERVADALSKFLRGDESWRTDFNWRRLEIRKPKIRRKRRTR